MFKSQSFGRIFWVDDNDDFRSCPQNVDGTGDFTCEDYVSEWDDWEGVDMDKLFNIHKFCIINKLNYAGSITHNETPKVINSQELEGDISTVRDDDYAPVMNTYDENLYNEIVKDSTFSYGKFNETNYPLHLQQQ